MKENEIIEVMNKRMSSMYINQYKIIYELASGKKWTQCLCGNGMERLYCVCVAYANNLKIKK